ncbi:MAG: lipopolysaccharide biosynthesis protein [Planctomycetota bacterium]|jgi:O-antigen/teichoic acid export membrane protein
METDPPIPHAGAAPREDRPHRRFLAQTSFMIVALSAASVVNVLYVTLIARSLDEVDLGVFFCAQSILLVAGAPGGAVQTFLAGVYASVPEARGVEVSRRWGRILAATSVVLILLFTAASPVLAPLLRFPSHWPMVATGLAVGVYAPLPLLYGRLQGRQRFGRLGGILLIEAATRPLAALLLVWAAILHATTAVASITAGFFTGGLLAWLFGSGPTHASPDSAEPAETPPSSGLAATLAALLALSGFSYLDMVFAQYFLGATPEGPGSFFGGSGSYGAAAFIGRAFIMVTFPLVLVMFPKVARARRFGESGRVFLRDTAVMTLTVWAAGWGVCAAFPHAIADALFPAYPETADLIRRFPLAILPAVILTLLTYYNLGRRRYGIAWILVAGVAVQWVGYSLFHGSNMEILTVLGVTGAALCGGVIVFTVARELKGDSR